jgi:hypothetical protein
MPWVVPTFGGAKEGLVKVKEEFDKLMEHDIENHVKKIGDLVNVLEAVKAESASSEGSDSSSSSTVGGSIGT